MKVFYRQGYRDGYEEALRDCEEQLARSTENGVRLAYVAILERIKAQDSAYGLLIVRQELEDALGR